MIKAVIFDVDDTLVNTWKEATRKHIKLAKDLGLPIPKAIDFGRLFGLPWDEMIKITWPQIDVKDFINEYVKSNYKTNHTLASGAEEVVRDLKQKDLYLGIVTSRKLGYLKTFFKELNFDIGDFQYVQAEDQNEFKKPNPRVFDHLRESLKNNGIKEDQTLYVGDAIYDYQATKGTGLNFIAFLNGAWAKKEFVNEGLSEKFIIKSLKELPTIIKNWEKLEQELGKYITI